MRFGFSIFLFLNVSFFSVNLFAAIPSIQKDIPVFSNMQETLNWFEGREAQISPKDRRGHFLKVYHEVTLEMVNLFLENEFQNPDWVKKLMFEYLSLYRNALECDETKTCEVSHAWKKAFRENRKNKVAPSIQLLLSISAHVNRDLAIALAHIEADFSSQSQYEDFQRISIIFKRRMPSLLGILQNYQTCRISKLNEKEINAMISWVMTRTRKQAWDAGKKLSQVKSAGSELTLLNEIEYQTSKQNRRILFWAPLASKLICF